MADSIHVIQQDSVGRIHGQRALGRLYKNHGVAAANTSMPTKYQSVVVGNTDKRGFHSTAKRFNYDRHLSQNPGPGSYLGQSQTQTKSASLSKRGTGTFASKTTRRLELGTRSAPPPGMYELPSHLQSKVDFRHSSSTSSFAQPIAVRTKDAYDNRVPAPNTYKSSQSAIKPVNNVSAAAAFKSKSKREMINTDKAKSLPAPGQYEVNDRLVRDRVKVPFSSFKSTSNRKIHSPSKVPGPGEYNPGEAVAAAKKQEFPRKHYLCISAPAMELPSPAPLPGPGHYETRDFDEPVKHYMSSSMFVSGSTRWTGQRRTNDDFPGPAHYKPSRPHKQSFIYNASARWL